MVRKTELLCIAICVLAILTVSCKKKCDPNEHVFAEKIVKEAQCGIEGTCHKVCINCGFEEDEVIPALEHNFFKSFSVPPKCTEKGTDTYTCLHCGGSYEESIPELGHKSSGPSCLSPVYCDVCRQKVYEQISHDFDGCVCRICRGKTIYGHEYVDGVCKRCYMTEPKTVKTNGITIDIPAVSLRRDDYSCTVKSVSYSWDFADEYLLTLVVEVTAEWKIEEGKKYLNFYLFRDDGYLCDSNFYIDIPAMKDGEKKTLKGVINMKNVLTKNNHYSIVLNSSPGHPTYREWVINGNFSPYAVSR